jgi:carnitine 3-dehydrogenase
VTAPGKAAVVGTGVIGSGWLARLVLHGVDVSWFDPSEAAPTTIDRALANAEKAWSDLGVELPQRGSLRRCGSIAEAVAGAELVVENVPERLEAKLAVFAEVEAAAPTDALLASSTSGFRPSVLQDGLAHPERLVVAHPFNPVYLLPLVEVVGGASTSEATVARAMGLYRSINMHPLHVRVEIDAFIADRLLEAVWREALWLVNDGVATTEEIDDAIRYGFGLRWAQMGLFDTYRVAGGDGGMRHFIAQFGEALDWPWTKLTDTPELTEELIDTIARQSDAQSGHLSINELESARDANLVAILNALAERRWGAGTTINTARTPHT